MTDIVNITEWPCCGVGGGRGGVGSARSMERVPAQTIDRRNDPLMSIRNLPKRNAAPSAQSQRVVLRGAAYIGAIESVLKSLG